MIVTLAALPLGFLVRSDLLEAVLRPLLLVGRFRMDLFPLRLVVLVVFFFFVLPLRVLLLDVLCLADALCLRVLLMERELFLELDREEVLEPRLPNFIVLLLLVVLFSFLCLDRLDAWDQDGWVCGGMLAACKQTNLAYNR